MRVAGRGGAAVPAATEGLDVGGGLLAAEGGDRRGVGGAAVRPVRGPVQQVDDVADLPVGGRGGRGRLVGARGGWLVGGGLAGPGRGRRGVGPGSGVGAGRRRAGLGDKHPRPVAALGGEVAEPGTSAAGPAAGAGRGKAIAGVGDDQLALQLGEHGEHAEHGAAFGSGGVDARFEHPESSTPRSRSAASRVTGCSTRLGTLISP